MTATRVTAESTRELIHYGYRPVVLGLLGQGASPKEVQEILDESYGCTTSLRAIKSIMRSMGLTTESALAQSTQKEMEALRLEALVSYTDFKDIYTHAKQRLTFDRDRALEEMQFAADQFGKWWDRISKFYPLAQAPQSNTTNIVTVIQNEMAKGLNPDRFQNILEVLDAEAGVPPTASPQVQQQAEDAQVPAEGTSGEHGTRVPSPEETHLPVPGPAETQQDSLGESAGQADRVGP